MTRMLDTLDVPDVFATASYIEDAGGGCVRIYPCIIKGGVLVPVGNAVVFPASCILRFAATTEQFARKAYQRGLADIAVH